MSRAGGKPDLFTQTRADDICRRLSEGEPLVWICRDEGMPAKRTVSDWRKRFPEFKEAMREARKDGYDVIAARLRGTARGLDGGLVGDSTGDVQRDKLIIDTDLKLLAKWDSERYGDKMKISGDRKNPIGGMTMEQIDARLAELMAKKGSE